MATGKSGGLNNGYPWLSAVPSAWKARKISSMCYVHGRIGFKGYSRQDLVSNETPGAAVVFGGTNIEKNGTLDYEVLSFLSPQKYLESPEIALNGGEILMTKVGAGVGDCAIYDGRFERATINPNVLIIEPKSPDISADFLRYRLISSDAQLEIRRESTKAGAQPAINQAYVKRLRVSIPVLAEQQFIVEFLNRKTAEIDSLIEKLSLQVELLEQYRRELIARTVTRGLDPDVPMRDSGISWIGEIPSAWSEDSLKSMLRRVSTKNKPERRVLSVERVNGVVDRETEGSPDNHNRLPDDLSGYLAVDRGQFAMNKMKAWRGSYGVSRLDGIVSPAYYVFELNYPNPEFFNWAIRSDAYVPFFGRDSYGIRTDQWDFKMSALRSIPFFSPPIDEQNEIVAYLERETKAIDSSAEGINRQIELLSKYRKQVINDAVNGKVRVGEVA